MFKLSPELRVDGVTAVENKFILDYLPFADGDYVKVFFYGLLLATRNDAKENSVDILSRVLALDTATVAAALDYWQNLGLISLIGDDITYISTRSVRPSTKIHDVDKYREFNRLADLLINARTIQPNEFNEYYAFMERFDIDTNAMIAIVSYCVKLKGNAVSYRYILAVARNLVADGYRTYEQIENRLEEYGVYYHDLCAVFSAMGAKKQPDHEAVNLYKSWVLGMHIDRNIILAVAKDCKRLTSLNEKLIKYNELGLTTVKDIEDYENKCAALRKLSRSINKEIGVYYEDTDPEIKTYVQPWLDLGFEPKALIRIARYCMQNGVRTLAGMKETVAMLYSDACLTEDKVEARFASESSNDAEISVLLAKHGFSGGITPQLRAAFSAWRNEWNISPELLEHAATLAENKQYFLNYMNTLLANWHARNIKTVEEAALVKDEVRNDNTVALRYTEEELNSLFINLTDDKGE